MKIGIGVTVHNRNAQASATMSQIRNFAPKNSKIVIVDDASKVPFKGATFRFNVNAGIASAKNKCIELLYDAGCTHFFLFDDDCHPIKKGWEEAYISTGINHLCMIFDRHSDGTPNGIKKLKTKHGLSEYSHACGCMLYFTREVVDKVGGMDEGFGQWGYEHVSYSRRIHNNFLTPRPFMDIENSFEWFRSLDREKKVERSVPHEIRLKLFQINKQKYQNEIESDRYIPFKQMPKAHHGNVIITSFFNYTEDSQRGVRWDSDISQLMPLINSCIKHKQKLIIFTDCLIDNINSEYVQFEHTVASQSHSPNVYRWIVYQEWMNNNSFDKAWFVDSTDVILLKEPFGIIEDNKLYCGDECDMKTDNRWMRQHQERYLKISDYRAIISRHGSQTLINCGIVGGSASVITELIEKWANIHKSKTVGQKNSTDMAVFNYIVRKYFNNILVHGEKINTKFKHNEQNNTVAIWKHK